MILRLPIVAFAFVWERLRRLPGGNMLSTRTSWLIGILLVAAVIALSVTLSQRSPQRVSMANLVAGELAPLQSWIIVTGDLRATASSIGRFRYHMTDPSVPGALLIVTSDEPLAEGTTTVSGTLVGGRTRAQAGFGWVGQLRADPLLAREQDPPWLGLGLGAVALLIGLGARTTYPIFLRDRPSVQPARSASLPVRIRRHWPSTSVQPTDAVLELRNSEPLMLHVAAGPPEEFRLHSAHSSYEVGRLWWLSEAEPALLLRPASGDVLVSFASSVDRDTAVAALLDEIQRAAGEQRTPDQTIADAKP